MTNTSQIRVSTWHPHATAAAVACGSQKPAHRSQFLLARLLALAVAMAPIGIALGAPQTKPAPPARPVQRTVIVQPSANARFQQTVQQQQVRDQLQKAQVEQQNRQVVSDNSRRPHDNNPPLQQQIDQSSAAQQRIEQARQQDMINRYQATPPPAGRVVVPQNANPKPSGG
jgi:hypothetical protein